MSDLLLNIVVATPTVLIIQSWGDRHSLQPERRYQIDLMDFDPGTYRIEHDLEQSIISIYLDSEAEYNIQTFVNSTDLNLGVHANVNISFCADDLIDVSFRSS